MSRIQIPFAILTFIVSVLCFAPDQPATAQNVNIPDAKLRDALEKKLGKNAGDAITQAEMARLGWLDGRSAGIRNLTGLEFATNLTWLVLGENQISDISPIQGLVSLTTLYLDTNQISDFSPIAGLIDNLDKYTNGNQAKKIPTWDVNQDGNIDILDLTAVSQNFGTAAAASPRADVNGDGTVDILDLVAVASHFGESTKPSATKPAATTPAATPGTCFVGMTLKPGESCSYNGSTFKVQQNGRCVTIRGINVCGAGLNYNQFSASKNDDGTWTINSL